MFSGKYLNKYYAFFLVLIILFCIVYFFDAHSSKKNAENTVFSIGVKCVKANKQNWQPQIQATGTVGANQGIMLKSEIAGNVTKINIHSGQTVKAGDLLFEINPAILNAQLTAAQAKANLSAGDYQRAIKLLSKKALSQQEADRALAQKNQDTATVNAIKAELDQHIVRAPISGKLGLILFNLGDYIHIGQNLINLQSSENLRVDFYIPENKLSQVSLGNKVDIQTDSPIGISNANNSTIQGNVTAIDTAIDANTRSIAIRANIPDRYASLLLPGNFVQVILYAGKTKPYVTIPQQAVVYDIDSHYVYILQKDHVIKKSVVLAEQNSDSVAIQSGVQQGDQVIIEGQLKIEEGSPAHAIY